MSIIQMSTSATFLITAIIIVRSIAIDKLPKKVFVLLWFTVFFRLLFPFAIPSQLSIFTLLSRITAIPAHNNGLTEIPNTAIDYVVSKPIIIPENVVSITAASVVWLIGIITFIIFHVILYFKGYQEFATSLPIKNRYISNWIDSKNLFRKIQVRTSDKIKSPLTYGVFRPIILLPKNTDWENEQNLQCILTHEYVHIKRFDALTKIILSLLLCIHWFNPMVWVMYLFVNRDLELSCDEKVVNILGDEMKLNYANTLMNLNIGNAKQAALVNSFCNYVFEERINSITRYKAASCFSILTGIMIAIALLVTFATSAMQ